LPLCVGNLGLPWRRFYPDREEFSIRVHQSGIAAENYLSHLRDCEFFKDHLLELGRNLSRDDLSKIVELLRAMDGTRTKRFVSLFVIRGQQIQNQSQLASIL